jgi:cytidylate kinase
MKPDENFVLAITRTCGSGGTTIGTMLANKYQINLYDKKLLQLASEDSGINEALFAKADESIKNTILYKVYQSVYNGELIPPESGNFVSDSNLFNYQAKVLKELSQKESYIVIGRCGDFILKDNPNMVSIFLYASEVECIRHEMERSDITEKQAKKHIKKMDQYRSDYYKFHTGKKWKNSENYDLSINTGKIGYEKVVDLIDEYLSFRFQKEY